MASASISRRRETPISDAERAIVGQIRAIMERRRLTITALAEMAGSPRESISRVLSGGEALSVERLCKILASLGVSLSLDESPAAPTKSRKASA